MGYLTELNTLLGLPNSFDTASLAVGKTYSVVKERERSFPLHIAMLIVDSEWNFYGYATVNSSFCKEQKTTLEFAVLSLFNLDEKALYKRKFIEAAKKTGEIK